MSDPDSLSNRVLSDTAADDHRMWSAALRIVCKELGLSVLDEVQGEVLRDALQVSVRPPRPDTLPIAVARLRVEVESRMMEELL